MNTIPTLLATFAALDIRPRRAAHAGTGRANAVEADAARPSLARASCAQTDSVRPIFARAMHEHAIFRHAVCVRVGDALLRAARAHRMQRAACAFALCAAAVRAQAPAAPTMIAASAPNATSIRLTWTDASNDETGFRIERDGAVLANIAANSVTYDDNGLTTGTTYVYRVGAVNANGVSWSPKAWALPSATAERWIIGDIANGEARVGYTYCDYFEGYDPTDYHFGVDAMRIGNDATGKKKVQAPLPGRIHSFSGAGVDQNLQMQFGAEYYLLSHLQNSRIAAADAGGWIMAGVAIAEVGNNAFGAYGAHVHTNRDTAPYNFAMPDAQKMRHFLELYRATSLRDPGGKLPDVLDAQKPSNLDADDERIQFRGDNGGAYVTKKTAAAPQAPQPAKAFIVSGAVDIVAECQDDMQHPDKPAALYRIGYWIEAKRRRAPDVRSEGTPYVLFRASPHLFDGATDHTKHVYDAASKQVAYNATWSICHHYIVTNTKGTDGAPAKIDAAQSWVTNAKNVAAGEPNGVGKGVAAKAAEAYFPDGPYRVYVQPSDLIHRLVLSPESTADVWVENFPPAVVSSYSYLGVGALGLDQVCAVHVTFSESMNKAAVESALTFTDNVGNPIAYHVTWSVDAMQLDVIPDSFSGYHEVLTIDASKAKDLSGGAAGTGASLDSEFGNAAHDGTANGAAEDNVRIEFSCA